MATAITTDLITKDLTLQATATIADAVELIPKDLKSLDLQKLKMRLKMSRKNVGTCGALFVQHSVATGALLVAIKARLDHGKWEPWLEANFDGGKRTAQRYMETAQNAIRQHGSNTTGLSYFDIPAETKQVAASTAERSSMRDAEVVEPDEVTHPPETSTPRRRSQTSA